MTDREKYLMKRLLMEVANNKEELSLYITNEQYGKAAFLDGYIHGLEYAILTLDPLDGTRLLLEAEVTK